MHTQRDPGSAVGLGGRTRTVPALLHTPASSGVSSAAHRGEQRAEWDGWTGW